MITIQLLGTPRVLIDGVAVRVQRRKAVALLAYLAATPGPQSRESLAALLWPDSDTARALAYLRTAIWALNKTLGPDWATVEADALALNPDAAEVDLAHFATLADSCSDGADAVPPQHCAEGLARAASLYRDDFMAGFSLADSRSFDDWQGYLRESLRGQLGTVLERLVSALADTGQYNAAISHARRWVALDPLHEPAHRALMRLYAWSGQMSAALRQFHEVERVLRDELDVPVAPETANLHARIQARDLPTPGRAAPLRASRRTTSVPRVDRDRTPDGRRTASFIGREAELAEIERLLADPACHLLTLIGPGGAGKTRLAGQAAQRLRAGDRYPDGVYFVPLAPITSPEYLIDAITQQIPFLDGHDLPDAKARLIQSLKGRRVLLVLDNFEHLMDAAPVLGDLLLHLPELKILVTSRERLNLQAEWLLETGGLPVPASTDDPRWREAESVQLFVLRARRARPDFALSDADGPALLDICQMVDGMPLGIELAAIWVQMLTLPEIADEIHRDLDFLATEMQDLPPRHRSLRAVFEHSWRRLRPDEQHHFSRLSLFVGPFTLDAARQVTGVSLPVLLSLVNRSLMRRRPDTRFEVHELLRQYAEEKLTEADHRDAYADYCRYHADLLADQLPRLKGWAVRDGLEAIFDSLDNLRKAWALAVENDWWPLVRRMVAPLWWYYTIRSRYQEKMMMMRYASERLSRQAIDDDLRGLLALILAVQAHGDQHVGHRQAVQQQAEHIEALLDRLDDPTTPEAALALTVLVGVRNITGYDLRPVEALAWRAHAYHEANGDRYAAAYTLYKIARVRQNDIRYDEVREIADRCLAEMQAIGNPYGIAIIRGVMTENATTLGKTQDALAYIPQTMQQVRLLDDPLWLAGLQALYNKLKPERTETVPLKASLEELLARASLPEWRASLSPLQQARGLYEIGVLQFWLGEHREALGCLADAAARFDAVGDLEGMVWARLFRASSLRALGEMTQARALLAQAQQAIGQRRFPWGEAGIVYELGCILLAEGDLTAAYAALHQAVTLAHAVHSSEQTLRHLSGIVRWLIAQGQHEAALRLAGMIRAHRTVHFHVGVLVDEITQSLPLDPAQREALLAQGAALTLDEAVAALPLPQVPVPAVVSSTQHADS